MTVVGPRPSRIGTTRFTCFRLVRAGDELVAMELHYTTTRMAAFVTG